MAEQKYKEKKMHKMVNGKRVELSKLEESEMKAEWEANKAERTEESLSCTTTKRDYVAKLRASNISDEAIVILKPELEPYMGE